MRPFGARAVARLESFAAVDGIAGFGQRLVRRVVPSGSPVGQALAGAWLGHRAHPPLTDVVIGAWTSTIALDLLGGPKARPAADRLLALGVAGSLPTALTGLSDWADLPARPRRVGSAHAAANTAALALQIASLRARRRGSRRRGAALTLAGYAVASVGAWLGGHLTFALGAGVSRAALADLPRDWTPVEDGEPADGELIRAAIGDAGVLLAAADGRVHAMLDRCSHLGCSLAEGRIVGGRVVCACHGSEFALNGSVQRGPATTGQPALDVRRRNGRLEVRRAAEPARPLAAAVRRREPRGRAAAA